jgi:hypothetical protein
MISRLVDREWGAWAPLVLTVAVIGAAIAVAFW